MSGVIAYTPEMSVEGVDSYSPSAGKPALFYELLRQRYRFDVEHNTIPVKPVTQADLELVHDHWFVQGVLEGREANGFGDRDLRVAQSCLWTVGSMVAASDRAVSAPIVPVASLSSGFHHAGFDYAGGYCTFNGLMVAAALHLKANPQGRVGILDCDFHFGDGTADILRKVPLIRYRVIHHTAGRFFHGDGGASEVLEFQAWLDNAITDFNESGCSLVLYQAGADMHVQDPLGGLLNDVEMAQRDRAVFRGIHAPIVWNLAGGYRKEAGACTPVLNTHLATYAEAHKSVTHRRAEATDRKFP